jgi:hypothetical protein
MAPKPDRLAFIFGMVLADGGGHDVGGPIESGSVQNLSHFRLAERHPALAHAVMAPLICWSLSSSMLRYLFVDHAVPAMWRSLAAARLSAD